MVKIIFVAVALAVQKYQRNIKSCTTIYDVKTVALCGGNE